MSRLSEFKKILFRVSALMLMTVTFQGLNAQDILKLKSGREIKVSVIEENNDIIKYREFENPSGPVYSIAKDKVESVKYKKGSKPVLQKTPEEQAVKDEQPAQNSGDLLVVKKRFVYKDDIKLNSRSVKTIMEDNQEAIKLYESGKIMCDLSNSCALAVLITSFVSSSIANKQEVDADRVRISAIGLSIDGAFIVTAIILSSSGKKKIRKSVELYNSSVLKPVSYRFNFGLQQHGVGLGVTF